jgi:hypothetical protein
MWLLFDLARWSAVAGAGGALVRLLQHRDETVLLDTEAEQKKKL